MPNESVKKTLGVALGVCLVCSILVSSAAVALRSIQSENRERERLKNILEAGGFLEEGVDIRPTYERTIRPALIRLATGEILQSDAYPPGVNPNQFDVKEVGRDPNLSDPLPQDEDPAHIRRLPHVMTVYRVVDNETVRQLILPVYGKGLWSTLYGFLSIDADGVTIRGFTFYEHAETPGLGGEVDNPRWKAQWAGKLAFDAAGNVRISVLKGLVDASSPDACFQVDGLSGSTLTTRGVDRLVRFWLGERGYGPFLRTLRTKGL